MGDQLTLVLDAGPLSAFAEAGWFGALKGVAEHASYRLEITEEIREELRAGVHLHPANRLVLEATWIETVSLAPGREYTLFERYASHLAVGRRNIGECSVLARAAASGATAVVDDRAARRLAAKEGIECRGTLALLVDAIRARYLTLELVSDMADHLIAAQYRLPFEPGGFAVWARREMGLE